MRLLGIDTSSKATGLCIFRYDGEDLQGEDHPTILLEDEGVIDKDKSDLMQAVLGFFDVSVSKIITPRIDILAIDIDDDNEEILDTVLNSPYSRIPVYEDNIDNIIGFLSER